MFADIRPSLLCDFANSQRLDSRFMMDRNSPATFIGPNGRVQYCGVNEPRFQYDENGNCLGLLQEPATTNRITNSGTFASGFVSGLSVNGNPGEISPDGVSSAIKLQALNDANAKQRRWGFVYQASNRSVPYTFSVFIKSADFNKVRLQFHGTDGGWGGATDPRGFASFDLDAGTLNDSGNESTSAIVLGTKITKLADGWGRYSISFVADPTNTSSHISVSIYLSNNNYTLSVLGDSSESGIYVWGAQLEPGHDETTYIPTAASAVARSWDKMYIAGENFNNFYNPNEGTFLVEAKTSYELRYPAETNWYTNYCSFVTADDDTNRIIFRSSSQSVQSAVVMIANSSNQTAITTQQDGQFMKLILAAKDNDSFVCGGGSTLEESNKPISTIPRNLVALGIGTNTYTLGHNGGGCTIKRIIYWPQRLSNDVCRRLFYT